MNENQNNEVNSVANQVTPMNEVQIEGEVSTPKMNSNETVTSNQNQMSNEPPKNSKLSTFLLILLFAFLFAFVMGMPYINNFIREFKSDTGLSEIEKQAQEEEKKQQQQENQPPVEKPNEEETFELNCTLNNTTDYNYNLVQIQKFYYNSNNQVMSSKNIYQYTFTVVDDFYNQLKTQCDEDSLKYITRDGYTVACSYGDTNIEINHEFDLETFKPIIEGDINIQANASFKQDIGIIKSNLVQLGYICE